MTLDECEQIFDEINQSVDPQVLAMLLERLLSVYPVLNFEMGRGSLFYRARKSDSSPYQNISEMSSPPPSQTRVGRLNDPGKPCLYAATRSGTALTELSASDGEYFHIMGFKIKPNHAIRIGTIGELYHVHKTGYLKSLGTDPHGVIGKMLNSEGLEKGKLLCYIDAFLAELLADPNASSVDYIRTRCLAKLAYTKSGVGGFFYPSVQDQSGMNLTFSVEAYLNATQPVCIRLVHITKSRKYGLHDYSVLAEGHDIKPDGSLIWGSPQAQHIGTFFNQTHNEAQFLRDNGLTNPNAMAELSKFSSRDS
ncbi:RES domain-containing protein [Geothrix sp. SG200]|uniref:RES domain-containing protein n=1 Tax=Geothrix sp. SG200 TaxID=2922865 RepID=UPI001FADC795|nr:RES domain-containing protein [Geothrix sp. SG200]